MKNLSLWLALATGVMIGIFGVFVSVFADGTLGERLVTILIILMVYAVLGIVWGYWQPRYSGWWGIILGLPGVIILMLYMVNESQYLNIIYALLIVTAACFSSYAISKWRRKK